jgi:hypothetical protein
MDEFVKELVSYMNQSEARGNKVISIEGVRALLRRHQTNGKASRSAIDPKLVEMADRLHLSFYGANKTV